MSEDTEPGVRELPGALADYAAGVAGVLARGGVAVAIPATVVGLLVVAVVGGGAGLVLAAGLGPAVAGGGWMVLSSRVRRRLG